MDTRHRERHDHVCRFHGYGPEKVMNLHETYTTLIRRGMPEHPTLFWTPKWSKWWVEEYQRECEDDDVNIGEPAAQDLLTMHALRWYAEKQSLADNSFDAVWFLAQSNEEKVSNAATILQAILAATEHLDTAPRK